MGFRILRLNSQVFPLLLRAGEHRYRVVENPVPSDAVVVNTHMDPETNVLHVVLHSSEWGGPPAGNRIPELEPICEEEV